MKRSWVYMVSVYAVWEFIFKKFMVARNYAVLLAMRNLAACRLKGHLKLTMKRRYAQYEEEQKLVESGESYKKFNFHLQKTRETRRIKL